MTKTEAKRRVCAGAAAILDNDSENVWLERDLDGSELGEADRIRMLEAFEELCAELRRRSGQK
jgi:hypothetical protein